MSWVEFRDFVQHLPPTESSALYRSRFPNSWWWKTEYDFMAAQLFSLQAANWQRSGGSGDKPELVSRPREDGDVVAVDDDAMPLEDLRDFFAQVQTETVEAPKPVAAVRKKAVRLTADDVVLIKQLLAEQVPQKSIAAEFGVSVGCISSICRGRTWAHVGGE